MSTSVKSNKSIDQFSKYSGNAKSVKNNANPFIQAENGIKSIWEPKIEGATSKKAMSEKSDALNRPYRKK